MTEFLLDNPFILSILFYPRAAKPNPQPLPKIKDGTVPAEDVLLGYRLYIHQPDAPLILYFHGNGEIAPDHDGLAAEYHRSGASLLVVDYRGYGWSTGSPKGSKLLPDAEAVFAALPQIKQAAGLSDSRLYVMGRSLGSAPAIHLAHLHPEAFNGLIVESGFAHVIPLLARLGIPPHLLADFPDPIGNVRKMEQLHLPLLVIHGERDTLLPVANGQTLYEASPAQKKRILRLPQAGHNDLLYYGRDRYFAAIADMLNDRL